MLSTAETARRLGVKPQTVYAYVSRGMLTRHRDSDGRRSRFDPTEVERLGRSRASRRACRSARGGRRHGAHAHRRRRRPVLPRTRRDGARALPLVRAGRRAAVGFRRHAHPVALARRDGEGLRGRAGRAARERPAGRADAGRRRRRRRDGPAARRPPPRRGAGGRADADRDGGRRPAAAVGPAGRVDRGAPVVAAGGRPAEPLGAQHAGRRARPARRPRARGVDPRRAGRGVGLGRPLPRRAHRPRRARRRAARRERRRGRGDARGRSSPRRTPAPRSASACARTAGCRASVSASTANATRAPTRCSICSRAPPIRSGSRCPTR